MARPPRDHEFAAQFARVEMGMSAKQVEAIFGKPGSLTAIGSHTPPGEQQVRVRSFSWHGMYEESVVINFDDQDQVVDRKIRFPEESARYFQQPTVIEKVGRWLGLVQQQPGTVPVNIGATIRTDAWKE